MSTKTRLHWCVNNAHGDPVVLRQRILNSSKHYQVVFMYTTHNMSIIKITLFTSVYVSVQNMQIIHIRSIHTGCHDSSPCNRPGYSPSKILLRNYPKCH